jgi:anthranilate phosphoribosyltransferase
VISRLVEALGVLGSGQGLTEVQSRLAVDAIMEGDAPEPVVAAFLTALRFKGESAEELAGAVAAVRERSTGWGPCEGTSRVLDTCGTGGDGANTVNISTGSAIVVAACGVPVAKHGNRSASGNSGSAEVLAELGVDIEADRGILRRSLDELGLTFLFAPRFHPALRFAAPVRRQLPFRTLFNLVGPLANPARPAFQLIGVPDARSADLIASALARLGVIRAAVVTGSDGLDEVSLDGPTRVRWVESGALTDRTWHPEEFGLATVRAADLRVSGPVESASRLRGVFAGSEGPDRDTVLANAAAALLVAGRVEGLGPGVQMARRAIDDGLAADLLDRWARMTRGE